MSLPDPSGDDPMLDRLADRVLQGEESGPDGAGRPPMDPEDEEALLDLALAAAVVARLDPSAGVKPMPATLRSRVEADAARSSLDGPRPPRPRPAALRLVPWLGWAAAASLAVATIARRPAPPDPIPIPVVIPTTAPTAAERMARLAAEAPAVAMQPTDHPMGAGSGGRLVWSQGRQEGYLELRGLAEVDPSRGTYQLWIFDANRDPRYPIDGGVFAIADARAGTVVPIRAGLPVGRPILFAVTLEPPGGVVVSDRKRILLTANWDG